MRSRAKAFETEYDHVIVKPSDDGWVVCKANHHPITEVWQKSTAVGHAHGIADTVEVQD